MKGIGLAVLVCALAFVPAGTAGAVGPVTLGFGGGVNVPVGDAGDGFDNGFNVRGIVGFQPPALPFGVRGALGYEAMDLASTVPGVSGSASILSGIAGMKFSLGTGPIKPYLTAGLGAFSVSSKIDGVPDSGSELKFGIDGGVGVDLRFGAIGAFVEARMQNVYTNEGWNPSLSGASTLQVVPVTFGLTF
jgi:opacity protein-like surface antigen